MSRGRLVIPSARRLMHSLRDLGYDLPAAIADLVDNSLDASASAVNVDLGGDWRGSYLRVVDDGVGMTERELDEAMRYGSARRYGSDDLGQFGLGLKTASLSQCRRLSVATRTTRKGRIRIRRWDLDRVAESDAWVLERPGALDCRQELTDPLRETTGTVVLWEKLDRILGSRRPDGEAARRKLQSTEEDLRLHLAMIFHRFLSRERRPPRLALTLNGDPVEAWDPFCSDEPLTEALPTQRVRITRRGPSLVLRPFILPGQHHFSSAEAHARAAGPNRWNRQQGLYIYRRDRLIQSGGWCRLRTLDEHSKLARVAVELPDDVDNLFRINVAKMSVGLPDAIRPELRVLVSGIVGRAQDAYRRRARAVPDAATPIGDADDVPQVSAVGFGDYWPLLTRVLERELGGQPELLDRVLVALTNTSWSTGVPMSSVSDAGVLRLTSSA
jgi:Histidine kinase-, DNA gyrase B-, and HSP90-like ATPase